MADSLKIPKTALPFPEPGDPAYLQTMLAMRMFRTVPLTQYPLQRVARLLTEAKANGHRYYSHGLYSLETLAKANY